MSAKRVLIICYYWPPAGGPGVQRWLKFVKYFGEFGIEPVVFVPENAHYPLIDEAMESEVPPNTEIIRFPIKEPYRFAKLLSKKKTKTISSGIISEKNPSILEKAMLFVRGNLFIPDARVGWVKHASAFLQQYLKEQHIDTIVTTGPPHSLHLIGLQLKKAMRLRWIADFRDPWTTIHYHKSLRLTAASEAKHKALEKEVLTTADHVVVTSAGTKQEFAAITDRPISVITNGYDEESTGSTTPDKNFSLVHVGSLLSNRNPTGLWQVLAALCEENADFAAHLRIKLAGTVSTGVKESLASFGLTRYLQEEGYVAHEQAVQLQRNAQVLLLLEMDQPETRVILPGKLFEYLMVQRPILAIGPAGSDIKAILEETKAGVFLNASESESLKKQLLIYFDAYRAGSLNVASTGIEKYSRKALTESYANLLQD